MQERPVCCERYLRSKVARGSRPVPDNEAVFIRVARAILHSVELRRVLDDPFGPFLRYGEVVIVIGGDIQARVQQRFRVRQVADRKGIWQFSNRGVRIRGGFGLRDREEFVARLLRERHAITINFGDCSRLVDREINAGKRE